MALQDEHKSLDIAIWNELLAVLPEGCSAATLTVGAQPADDGTVEMPHSIELLDGSIGVCFPSDEIYRLTYEHFQVFNRHGRPWRQLAFTVRFDFDAENWRCSTDYEH